MLVAPELPDNHQSMRRPSRKKPPVGSPTRVAAQTIDAAPFSTLRLAPCPPMSVRTQPGQTALTMIRRAPSSGAQTRTSALSAIFETRYPDDGQPRSR